MGLSQASGVARTGVLGVVLACGLAMSAPALAQVDAHLTTGASPLAKSDKNRSAPNADFGPGLPFFDSRVDADGLAPQRATDAIAAARAAFPGAREGEIARLRATVDGAVVDDDMILGTARYVRSPWKFLTTAKGAAEKWTAGEVVRGFIDEYPALMEIDAAELDRARVDWDYLTDHNGMRHQTYQQQIRGADLFECMVRANVSAKGELINIQNTMLPRPAGDFATPAMVFDAASAIKIAAANIGVTLSSEPEAATEAAEGNLNQTWKDHPDLRSDEKLTTELKYFAIDRKTIHPAWMVQVPQKGVGHTYDILVDATDGAILWRHDHLVWDTTQPVTLRVFPSDGIAPGTPGNSTATTFQFPVVSSQLLTFNPADVTPWSPNGWINDGNTQTVGNNVDAHTDTNADNVADTPRPDGGASRVFDLTFNPALAPGATQTQKDATVVELFYRANWYHDKLMALGFNEAARNFQTTNFSGQGTGNDAVQADAQDGSGTDNANFSTTGTDGSTGRCQMYIFTGPTPDRDGSFEGDIVYHELTHGTSIRLHGGLSSAPQSTGMGEGWSDFVALCLLAEPTDDPDAVYPMGGYTTYQLGLASYTTNYYFGIRRFPYSTDLNKAPQTYADIASAQINFLASIPRSPVIGNTATEVHNVGEVWCEMLNEVRAALWRTYGFAGNQRALQLVIDGMKLDPSNPTLIQARDAIMLADLADYAGADTAILWQAFAKRGLGSGATSPASTSTVGIVESYAVPTITTFTYPDGLPKLVQPGVDSTFRVNVTGVGASLTAGTGQMFVSINGGTFTPSSMASTGTNQYSTTLSVQSCPATISYYFAVGTSAGTKTDPPGAPAVAYRAAAVTASTNVVTDGFEAASGWTTGAGAGDTATGGLWERGTPQQTTAQSAGAHGGAACWVTGASGATISSNDVDGGFTTLLSPTFNLSGYSDALFSYWRWYFNAGSNNTARIDVSTDNGTTWTRAETLGPGATSDSMGKWRLAQFTLSSLGLAPSATVRFRFIVEDLTTINANVEAALDDFRIDGLVCTTAPVGGACCAVDGSCTATTSAGCAGSYQGDGTACTPTPCVPANYTVTVTTIGLGRGTVSSSNGAIQCPGVCQAQFAYGTNLAFTAAAAPGSAFVGWSGACAGTGTCSQTITGPVSITAEFRCRADFNGADGITVQDIFDFLAAWFAGGPGSDFNGVDGVTVQDIFDFLAGWFTGCP